MQTVLLAAGDGRRLRPLTATTPKPLLPVAGDPLVCRLARTAVAAGATKLSVVVPPDHGAFVERLGRSVRGRPVEYVVQPRPTGTAEAVRRATDRFEGPFAVLPGDCLVDRDSVERLFSSPPGVGVTGDPASARSVASDGGDPTGTFAAGAGPASRPTGACSLPADADGLFAPTTLGGSQPESLLDRAVGTVEMTPVHHGYCVDVDRPDDVLRAHALALDEWADDVGSGPVDGAVSAGATVQGPVAVGDGASVGRGATVRGPSLVAEDATVEPRATVGPGTYLGPDAVVGRAARVAESVVLGGSRIGSRCRVRRALLGRHATFAPNTTVVCPPSRSGATTAIPATDAPDDATAAVTVVGARVRTGVDTTVECGAKLSPGTTTEAGDRVSRNDC